VQLECNRRLKRTMAALDAVIHDMGGANTGVLIGGALRTIADSRRYALAT